MKKMTYNIYSLGCKVNKYDADKLSASLEQQEMTKVETGADFAIIYTCSVTGSAVHKNKQMIKKAKKENPEAKLILDGCWPRVTKIDKDDFGVDFIVDKDDKFSLSDFIFMSHEKLVDITGLPSLITNQSRARYFIKVQDGCEQFCSYCIIPFARGPLRSRAKKEIIIEIEKAVENGFREVVLSGIHLGLYGHDADYKLTNLVRDILKIKNLTRLRLSSIELNEVTDELIDLMVNNNLCKHLHIPLQSGCDKVLHSMKRPYNTEQFRNKINKTRKIIPDIAITTDVIVGFPGESDEDFLITQKFIEEINFSRVHVFSFSAHEKTPAYSMPDQIEKKIISQRAKTFRQVNEKLENDFQKKFKNKELEVILVGFRNNRAILKTEYYFDIFKSEDSFEEEDIGKVKKIIC